MGIRHVEEIVEHLWQMSGDENTNLVVNVHGLVSEKELIYVHVIGTKYKPNSVLFDPVGFFGFKKIF